MIDLHVHTSFCDGADVPEEIVKTAVGLGMECIGFSGHSHTCFDERYCMSPENTKQYIAEIERLKEKYSGKIRILCGTELDLYSDIPTDGYDYIIGSVHYFKINGEYIPVDDNTENLKYAAEKYFDDDFYALAERYFQEVSQLTEKTRIDIIGHFDLISKFNEKEPMFDERNDRYRKAWRNAADIIIKYNIPFEVNTGAMSRGYKKYAYPNPDILRYIHERGGKIILSSDSHKKENLCFGFREYKDVLKEIGFDDKDYVRF